MKKKLTALMALALAVLLGIFGLLGPQPDTAPTQPTETTAAAQTQQTGSFLPYFDGHYDSARDVSFYLQIYGCLPGNYITKSQARSLGWEGGSVERVAPGCCIGGDVFRNYEGQLPDAPGRSWTECDIDTLGESSRGAKRIVFSNDGLIYYTEDHYETFELLFGEP